MCSCIHPVGGVTPYPFCRGFICPTRRYRAFPLKRRSFSAILLPVKKLLPYALLALLALLAGLCALGMAGITPFGNATLCWQDNGQQVASDFGYVRGVWEGRHTLDWSYACGGSPRSSFHPTFNNLVSPFTWAVAAIPGISAVTGLSLLFLLQLTLLPLGALFYLRRRFSRLPGALSMALALAYAFGGFVLTKYTFLPFLNVAILFPWYVAALDALLRRGRWVPYCLLLVFMLAVGTYFAWMWLLFTAVYAAARTGWRWQSPVRQHTLLLFLASAGALMLSSFSWAPSLMVTLFSSRAGEAHFWWNATRAETDAGATIYLFSLPCLLAALLAFCRLRCSRYWMTLLILLVGLVFISATSLWHLSRPWDFAGRFGYMADFMLICIAAEAAQRRRVRWRLALAYLPIGGALLLACSFLLEEASHGRSYQASADRVYLAEWAADGLLEKPEGRVKSDGWAAVENLAFFTPFDSLSHFTACITSAQEETLSRWGYQKRAAVISTEGGTLATDTVLGIRTILSQYEDGDYAMRENPYYFGVGMMVPQGMFPLWGDDPIERHQALMGGLLGEEHAGVRHELTAVPGEALHEPQDGLPYLLYDGSCRYDNSPYERWGGVEEPPSLCLLPICPRMEGKGEQTVSVYQLSYSTLAALRDYGRALPVRCEYAGRRMRVSCCSTAERPLLFLPFLWQAGYEARVDGESAVVQNLDGFVGIAMPAAGEHEVELVYEAPGRFEGWVLTALSLLLVLGGWLLPRRRVCLASPGGLNGLCRRLLLGVSWVLLLWPLLVLPIGLCWR